MVVTHDLKDLFDISVKTDRLSLPASRENPYRIEFENDNSETEYQSQHQPMLPFSDSDVFEANILESRRLTAEHEDCKDVYEITFNITGSNFLFKAGDTIGVIPHNSPLEVDLILNHLNLAALADKPYRLHATQKGAKIPAHVPVKSSLRHVLTHCLDLRGIIKKLFLLALSKYTKDENERKVLEYICSKEGSSTYTTHIINKNICILDLFTIFKTCKPPMEVLMANLPRLLPRPYSIVNSILKEPNKLKICFSVMDIGNNRKGLTTGWLENIISNSLENGIQNLSISSEGKSCKFKVPIYLRKNITGFSLPDNMETPLILLGPGTGVAPFVGFLQERALFKEKNPEANLGETWLFFGCRNPELDYIYEEEFNTFVNNKTLSKLNTAFSRVNSSENKHIQDSLHQNGETVVKLLKKGASIFICGDLKTMASQVKDVLVQNLIKYDDKTQEEAEKYIAELQKEKRYVVDMWS